MLQLFQAGLVFLVLLLRFISPPSVHAPVITVFPSPPPANKILVQVIRVIDGDTLVVSGNQKVRLIGINAPEIPTSVSSAECFGPESAAKVRETLTGRNVLLEKDVSQTDQYGRLLRYVYLDGVMVNEELVRSGYARAAVFPPDVKYQDKFKSSQDEARQAGRGLWSGVCAKTPTPKLSSTPVPTISIPISNSPCVCPPCTGNFCSERPCFCADQ